MAETEELQIKVTLVEGNTVEKLREMRKEIEALGGGGTAQQLERFSRQARDAREKGLKPFSEDLEVAAKRMVPFIGGIGGIATGLIAVGYAADKALDALNDFTKVQERIGVLGKQTGFDPAFVKMFQEEFKLAGVEDATRDLEGLSHTMADLTRANSKFRHDMMVGAGLEGAGAMQQFLTELTEIKDPSKFANKLREGLEIVRKQAIAKWGEQRGAEVFRKFEADIGMPNLDRLLKDLPEVSAEEKKLQAARQKAADDYLKTTREISLEWEHIKEFWTDETLGSSALANSTKWLLEQLKEINKIIRDPVGTQADPSKPPRWIRPPVPGAPAAGSATPGSAPAAPEPATSALRRPGGRVRLGGGAVPLMGGLAPDEWPESTNIEDRRGEPPFQAGQEEETKIQRELMEQTKRLADDLEQLTGTGAHAGGALGLFSGGTGGGGGLAAQAGINDIGGTGGGGGGGRGHPGGGGHRGGGGGGGGGGGDGGDGGGDGDGGAQSGSLAEQRAEFKKELDADPKLKAFAIDAMQHEGGIQSNFEQLMNMAAMRHQTIRKALYSGQYGPVNKGVISGNISAKTAAEGEAALHKVYGGSNITDYATDQGMEGDPNFAKYMANPAYWNMHKVQGAWFSAHGESGRKWAEQQRARDAAAAARTTPAAANEGVAAEHPFIAQVRADRARARAANQGQAGPNDEQHRNRFIEAIRNSRHAAAAPPDEGEIWNQEQADKAIFGDDYSARSDRNRFIHAAAKSRAAIDNGMAQRVEGTGKLSVHVNAPKGTKVGAEGGGIFKKTEVTRQTQMEPAASSMASQYQE
jgi:hypothetical protein